VSYCPECEAEIPEEFETLERSFRAPNAAWNLEVISLDPVEFDSRPWMMKTKRMTEISTSTMRTMKKTTGMTKTLLRRRRRRLRR